MNQSKKAKATQGKPKSRTNFKSAIAKSTERKQEHKAPVAKSYQTTRTAKPRFESRSNGDIVVHFREFIQDLNGSVGLSTLVHPVNPANPAIFPWLSQIASRFDLYQFKKLKICYEPSCATTATGNVMFAVDFDPTDATFTQKSEFLNTRTHCRSAPWDKCSVSCLYEDLSRRKTYITAQNDTQFSDAAATASLYFGTIGQAGTSVIGEVYIEYSVLLQSPQIGVLGSYGYQQAILSAANLNNTQLFGNGVTSGSDIIVIQSVSSATFQGLQSGIRMYVTLEITGTVLVGPAFQNGTAAVTIVKSVINAAATSCTVLFFITGLVGQTLNISFPSTTITATQWRILPYNPVLA